MIALFLHHDFDELICARPAASHSYRNPIERCHATANLGLLGGGMERIKKTCNGNNDVRLACEKYPDFKESYKKSVLPPKELLESVYSRLSLKDKPFRIVEAAEEEEIGRFIE